MSEAESAPPNEEDTPNVETTPQEDTVEDHGVVDYRSRYDNLLPEYTRKSQRLAELEAQLEQQQAGHPQYEDDTEYEVEEEYDPDEYRRIARQEAEAVLTARERKQAEQEAEIAFVNAEISTLEKELGEEFTDAEWDYLGRTSEDLRDEHGNPDVRRAYEHFNSVIEARKQKWVGGKRSAKPVSGPGAAEVVDLDDSNTRADYIDRIMAANVDPD